MKNIYHLLLLACISFAISSCDIGDNEADPASSFLKIYDHNDYEASYIPIDIKQTSDGGYLILAATQKDSYFAGVRLMKVDEQGEFEQEQDLSDEYVHPVGELMKINGNFYFMAMRESDLRAFIFMVDNTGTLADPIETQFTSPLATSATTEGNILLLSYSNSDLLTVCSELSVAGAVSRSASFTIGAGTSEDGEPARTILDGFKTTGPKPPYAIGKMNNQTYYFNGFYNYTLSLVFTSLNEDDDVQGVLQGVHRESAISSVIQLANNTISLSRYNSGDNYVVPRTELESLSIRSVDDLEGNTFPELVSNAPVMVKSISINGTETALFASNTKNGQIVLLAFEASSGTLVGTKYLGFGNTYEVAGFSKTEDEGLVVLGRSYLTGRFARICVFKLSDEELKELVD
ncbi:hypothetical protein LVD15_22520 [Fulvivirga maritima]|uniref:hypothetical protein n=1 Tax=Fulvivirga maritima TaxID=2904247 RepID=UPI001F2E00DB|nr:hypothetical protein [Fulvivirga maritima]UII26050.1 hypothetical protein LVD15_22520 [Fulvivirga maritima]